MALTRGRSPGRLTEARVPLTKERSQERELTPTMSRGPAIPVQPIDENTALTQNATAASTATVSGSGGQAPCPKPIPFRHLWKYATQGETWRFRLGVVLAAIAGVQGPAMSFFMKDLVGALFEPDDDTRRERVTRVFIIFICIGLGAWIITTTAVSMFVRVADSMSMRLRTRFFGHLMDKHVGWYDTHPTTEMSSRLTQDTYDYRLGLGVKFSLFVSNTTQAPTGLAVAFFRDWKLTLCLIGVLPVIGIIFGFSIKVMTRNFQKQSEFYARAGSRAESTLASITTVAALAGYAKEVSAYDETLAEAERDGVRAGLAAGISGGLNGLVFNGIFALGLWLGATFMLQSYRATCWDVHSGSVNGCFNGSTMLSVLLAILSGGFGMTIAFTQLSSVTVARAAAGRIYSIIEEPSAFSQDDPDAKRGFDVKGHIQFEAVKFFYPSRAEVWALNGVSFDVPAGRMAAFVGPSGSGKSTSIGLLMRFYDPQHGVVKLDGTNIRELNLSWMRSNFSLVQQEPILFSGTMMENILYGKIGATEEEAKEAARKANADNFIEEFADKYNTLVGEHGSALSGGQKQRVAIARAIIRKPHVLMLDEATSALDTQSERIVKKALDDIVEQGRHTTIVVAHRLATVKDANVIFVFDDGFLREKGTHRELVALEGGLYKQLAEMQELAGADNLSSQELVKHIGSKMQSSKTLGQRVIGERKVSRAKSGSEFSQAEIRAEIVRTTSRRSNADKFSDSLSRHNTGPLGATMINETEEPVREEKKEEVKIPEWDEIDKEISTVRLWHFQKQNACIFFAALAASVPSNAVSPFIGQQFGKSIGILMQPPATVNPTTGLWEASYSEDQVWKTVAAGCILYVTIAVVGFVSTVVAQAGLRRCSEGITRSIRRETLKAMLRQDQSYHDRYTPGQLADRLAHEAAQIKSFAGESLGGLLSLVSVVAVSVTVAMACCWQLAIAVVILTPLLMIGQAVQMKGMRRRNETRAGPVVSEAMGNIRTVAAFGLGAEMEKKYSKVLAVEGEEDRRQGWVSSCSQGYNAFVQFFMYGAVVFIASLFIDAFGIEPESVFQVFFTLVFSIGGALQGATTWAGDKPKGVHAMKHIFNTLDRVPAIDALSAAGDTIPAEELKGRIEFRSVEFSYPSQTATKVFRDLSFDVEAGKMYAFVGPSGCGKSTTVRLVLRLYDPSSGSVELDGRDLKTLNVKWCRSKMSWMQQEPVLFAGSIKTNIQYGAPDDARCEQEEVESAAMEANAHDFIMSFPKRYDEDVGDKGTQLSGGQKQRIAIARCLVRNPKILLLDEATSALDAESERIVQEALDRVLLRIKSTTLVIAHRLATIQSADRILVMADGAIVESGTHAELMAKPDGKYKGLAARQAM